MKKKKLVLITMYKSTKEKYLKDLYYFFDDYLDIEGYSISEGINDVIKGDLALIISAILPNLAKEYLSHDIEIVYMNRTFTKDSVRQLYDLPFGMKAMLSSNTSSSSISCISSLYGIGIKHLHLIPVYPGIEIMPDTKIAITPAQRKYVPKFVDNIIDIGWRVIDVSTLMDITTKLGIMSKDLEEKIIKYSKNIIPQSDGLDFTINNTSIIKNEMDTLLNVIDDGVIVTDMDYKIIHYNKAIGRILNFNESYIYNLVDLNEVFPSKVLMGIMEKKSIDNKLIKSLKSNKSFVVTKRIINVYDNMYGYVIIIKDITEFENLERKLRKQLVKQGYIAKYKFENIIGKSEKMIDTIKKAKKIACIDATTLITGESGTGKELFAQSIHNASKRKNNPFVAINCASLPSELLESELFGYDEGAFTGAKKGGKKGLFQLAHSGTIFLDEIGDMPIKVQVKLLRVLQEKEVMSIGSNSIVPIDVRVIAATNQNLKDLMHVGKFRKDLYYRLNVLNLYIPPLRERKGDIPYLAKNILQNINMNNKKIDNILMKFFENYSWEGNVRELKNCIEYMAYMGADVLTAKDLPKDMDYSKQDEYDFIEEEIFPELLPKEKELTVFILKLLKKRSGGRRFIYNQAYLNEIETTEHEIRKLMNYLTKKGFITIKTKRQGSILTDKGKKALYNI
ncbi:sigma-54 interaction domain-containing protein [Maledivibacter halophilus]|uniref:Transcriptional regulator containing PAS, AAA-type ATPase, and DNA-binding Fis domains n=1 Tax=Maledivibacter halophilus TaxID=36842 RepID=A0A1T5IT95_9FIRM|nr:sigma 54-interacting transcriptional regulator [Maledivibacter halophilus]SKC42345.1 Transcriptional regulator containing PAS, AAA-type ATPase, and DNA-binding Fis domains [Maledivibacter halophilus]